MVSRERRRRLRLRKAEEEAMQRDAAAAALASSSAVQNNNHMCSLTTVDVTCAADRTRAKNEVANAKKQASYDRNQESLEQEQRVSSMANRRGVNFGSSWDVPRDVVVDPSKPSPSSSVAFSQSTALDSIPVRRRKRSVADILKNGDDDDSSVENVDDGNSGNAKASSPYKNNRSSFFEDDSVDEAKRKELGPKWGALFDDTDSEEEKKSSSSIVGIATKKRDHAASNKCREGETKTPHDEVAKSDESDDESDNKKRKSTATSNRGDESNAESRDTANSKARSASKKRNGVASNESALDEADAEAESEMNSCSRRSPSPIRSETSSVASRSIPKNPLALGRENIANALAALAPLPFPITNNCADGLWSDDDDDEVVVKPARQKRAAKKKASPSICSSRSGGSNSPAAESEEKPKRRAVVPVKPPPKRLGELFEEVEEESADLDVAKSQLKPHFDSPKFGPFRPEPFKLGGSDDDDGIDGEVFDVPMSINRYLLPYQQKGCQFMYENITSGHGAILGDDMGLGKTVQVIAFLAALLKKSGTGLDLVEVNRRKRFAERRLCQINTRKEKALQQGRILTETFDIASEVNVPAWAPILVIAPRNIVDIWKGYFATWGHFGLTVCSGGLDQELSLEMIRTGASEVLICTQSSFVNKDKNVLDALCTVQWKLIIIDEFHVFKSPKTYYSKHLRKLRSGQECQVIGLTGTLMQNNHRELWNLVDLIQKDFLGDWKVFRDNTAHPIKLSRAKDADTFSVELGKQKKLELNLKLDVLYIHRTKEGELGDVLPEKDEWIVFCELSEIQMEVYKHILRQPDFVLLSEANAPCDCGVNEKRFQEYQRLSSKEQKIAYQRRNKHEFERKAKCCYSAPKDRSSPDGINPKAVLWRQLRDAHAFSAGDFPVCCRRCPFCVGLMALDVLTKLSSHVARIQAKLDPDSLTEGTKQHQRALDLLERAQVFLPEHILNRLPGGSHIRAAGVMDDHFRLSGKMPVLDEMLRDICRNQGRALLFSASTQTLDLIENYVRTNFTYLRMDGSTPAMKRNLLVERFNSDPTVFVFLLSTKACGLGINLVAADNVIMFDVEWNPANDAQAQNRAYRIGQDKHVNVYRLVSRGTVEEMKFLRQLYKIDLKDETIIDEELLEEEDAGKTLERRFRGVEGNRHRRGELFGLTNLLRLENKTFRNYKHTSGRPISVQYGAGVFRAEDLKAAFDQQQEEEVDYYELEGKARAKSKCANDSGRPMDSEDEDESESESENELGGETQINIGIFERNERTYQGDVGAILEDEDDSSTGAGNHKMDSRSASPGEEEKMGNHDMNVSRGSPGKTEQPLVPPSSGVSSVTALDRTRECFGNAALQAETRDIPSPVVAGSTSPATLKRASGLSCSDELSENAAEWTTRESSSDVASALKAETRDVPSPILAIRSIPAASAVIATTTAVPRAPELPLTSPETRTNETKKASGNNNNNDDIVCGESSEEEDIPKVAGPTSKSTFTPHDFLSKIFEKPGKKQKKKKDP